jgi:type IV pilus assembly protein PilC
MASARQPGAQARKAELLNVSIPALSPRVPKKVLAVFTRQLATLIQAGMPLLRGLRTLREQEESPALKKILGEVAEAIEGGSSLSEALSRHPKTFSRLYLNMVKAGELGGALDVTLRRLTEFLEKAQKIKGRVQAAMFYPCAVLMVAGAILILMMVFIVPKFQEVFNGLLGGTSMPVFTQLILDASLLVQRNLIMAAGAACAVAGAIAFAAHTEFGRRMMDRAKLAAPVLGPVFRKAAISRFSRTLGTLLSSGVPVLQALTIVKETAGNVIIGEVVTTVHDSVRQGNTIAVPLRASQVFPAMVAGMVDIGEQTGALPDMLMRIADNYDEEVDNAVNSMTSLLEPIMIVILAVVVGSIVVALFLPILAAVNGETELLD